jgi:hypothetical protein
MPGDSTSGAVCSLCGCYHFPGIQCPALTDASQAGEPTPAWQGVWLSIDETLRSLAISREQIWLRLGRIDQQLDEIKRLIAESKAWRAEHGNITISMG